MTALIPYFLLDTTENTKASVRVTLEEEPFSPSSEAPESVRTFLTAPEETADEHVVVRKDSAVESFKKNVDKIMQLRRRVSRKAAASLRSQFDAFVTARPTAVYIFGVLITWAGWYLSSTYLYL